MTKQEINAFTGRISVATRSELIVIMYEIGKNYVLSGVEAYNAGDMDSFIDNIKKAKRLVNELSGSLDYSYKISYELASLYMYMNKNLSESIVKKECVELDTIVWMLDKLRESFIVVAGEDKSGPVMKNVQTVYAGLTYSKSDLNIICESQYNRGFKA